MQIIKNMPAEEYHALERLSASGIKKLLVSSQDFWVQSWMNPNKREYESDALNLGRAYHVRLLEGEAKFHSSYAVPPKCDKRTKEGKEIFGAWKESHPTAEVIDQETYDDIMAARAVSEFTNGEPEVTVLWEDEETNVPMKARLDWLEDGHIKDLKTFSNSSNMDIQRLIARHVANYDYGTQAAVYLSQFPSHKFSFVFQQTGGINNCIVREFPKNLLLYQSGVQKMRDGINKFASMYSQFGTEPWYDDFANVPFTDYCFPLWAIE